MKPCKIGKMQFNFSNELNCLTFEAGDILVCLWKKSGLYIAECVVAFGAEGYGCRSSKKKAVKSAIKDARRENKKLNKQLKNLLS